MLSASGIDTSIAPQSILSNIEFRAEKSTMAPASTSHCWAQTSFQNERASAVVPTRAQYGLGNLINSQVVQISSRYFPLFKFKHIVQVNTKNIRTQNRR